MYEVSTNDYNAITINLILALFGGFKLSQFVHKENTVVAIMVVTDYKKLYRPAINVHYTMLNKKQNLMSPRCEILTSVNMATVVAICVRSEAVYSCMWFPTFRRNAGN